MIHSLLRPSRYRRQVGHKDMKKSCANRPKYTNTAMISTPTFASCQILHSGSAGGRITSTSPDGPQDESLWLRSAGVWLLGALVPNIILATTTEKVPTSRQETAAANVKLQSSRLVS